MKVLNWIILIILIWWGCKSCVSNNKESAPSQNQPKEWVMDYVDGTNGKDYHLHIVFIEKNDSTLRFEFYNDSGEWVGEASLAKNGPLPNYKWFGTWLDRKGDHGYFRLNEVFINERWQLVGDHSDGTRSDDFIHKTIVRQK